MRHPLVLALSLALLALPVTGCGGDAGPAGTWHLDTEATLAAMNSDEANEMPAPLLDAIKNSNVELELRADGTFHVKSDMGMGEDTNTASGTWSHEGDVVSFSESEHDGKKRDDPEVYQGTLDGGTMKLKPQAGMPFVLVMVKD